MEYNDDDESDDGDDSDDAEAVINSNLRLRTLGPSKMEVPDEL